MADKSTPLILDALTRAAADPTGLPLHGGKNAPGLFAATAPARQAAQRCKEDQFLRVVRTEKRGKSVQEICAITDKGLEYLLRQVHPRQVLENLVRAVEARQEQLDGLLACAQQTQANLDDLKRIAEKILRSLDGKERIENVHAAWCGRNAAAGPKEPDLAPLVLAPLVQLRASGAIEDCALPELYRRVQGAVPGLGLGRFHDTLRQLHEERKLYLHPWTGPLSELPEPACALLVGHEVAYYASIRD